MAEQGTTLPGAQGREKLVERIALAGGILGILSIGLYVVLYFQTEEWQILANAGLVGLAILCMIPARLLARRSRLEAAGYWLLLAVAIAFGAGNLVFSGSVIYNAIGGTLLILLVTTIIRPRRWPLWLAIAAVYLGFLFLFEWLEPIERYNISENLILSIHVPTVTTALVLLSLWQVVQLFRSGNIRTRLLVAFVALVLLPVIVLGAGVVYGGLQGVRQSSVAQLESVSVLKEGALEIWLEDLLIDLQLTLSGRQVLTHLVTVGQETPGSNEYKAAYRNLEDRFGLMLEQTGRYEELLLTDPQGKVLVSTDPDQVGQSVGNQRFFREGSQGPYIQPPAYSMADRRIYLYVALPVVNEAGEMLGILAGSASLDRLNEVMAQRTGLGETGQTYLVAFNQTLLTPTRTGDVNVWVSSDAIEQAVGLETSGSGLYDDYRGAPVVGAYTWLPELQSALIAEQEQIEAFGSIFTMLGIAAGVGLIGVLVAVVSSLLVTRSIATPLSELADTATQVAEGDLSRTASVERADEVGALAVAFNSMTSQVRELIESLEQRVLERTHELEQRSAYLAAAADVGRAASSILEAEPLLEEVVDLIREEFGLYYVGLFLVDGKGEWAELQAGTGEAGQAMLDRGHRLHIGGDSMIGWCIANQQARIALEAGADAVRLATPELPETRSEAALPLHSRGQVIGALSVQHTQVGAFDEDAIVVLQTMADQVAVALDNARLFAERQEAAEAVQRAYGELSAEAWREMLRTAPIAGYRSDERGVTEAVDVWRPEMHQAIQEGRLVRDVGERSDGRQGLVLPIKVRGEVVAVLDTYKPEEAGDWTEDELSLLQEIIGQLDIALEGARLHQDTQRRAAREETIRRVTDRMRRPREVEAILQSTLAELTKALGVPRAYVRLGTEAELSRLGNQENVSQEGGPQETALGGPEGNGGEGSDARDDLAPVELAKRS